jgi:integrase
VAVSYHVMVLLVATGARIGEVLALTWPNVDLAAKQPTIHINGTIVPVQGLGLVRQDETKTKPDRTLAIPPDAVEVLLQRKVQAKRNDLDLVFRHPRGPAHL